MLQEKMFVKKIPTNYIYLEFTNNQNCISFYTKNSGIHFFDLKISAIRRLRKKCKLLGFRKTDSEMIYYLKQK